MRGGRKKESEERGSAVTATAGAATSAMSVTTLAVGMLVVAKRCALEWQTQQWSQVVRSSPWGGVWASDCAAPCCKSADTPAKAMLPFVRMKSPTRSSETYLRTRTVTMRNYSRHARLVAQIIGA